MLNCDRQGQPQDIVLKKRIDTSILYFALIVKKNFSHNYVLEFIYFAQRCIKLFGVMNNSLTNIKRHYIKNIM